MMVLSFRSQEKNVTNGVLSGVDINPQRVESTTRIKIYFDRGRRRFRRWIKDKTRKSFDGKTSSHRPPGGPTGDAPVIGLQ